MTGPLGSQPNLTYPKAYLSFSRKIGDNERIGLTFNDIKFELYSLTFCPKQIKVEVYALKLRNLNRLIMFLIVWCMHLNCEFVSSSSISKTQNLNTFLFTIKMSKNYL